MNKKTRNDILILSLWRLFKVYLLFLFVFITFRIFFVYYFGDLQLLAASKVDLLQAFYLGWKYDNLVLSYIFAPIILGNILLAIIKNIPLYNFFNSLSRFYFILFSFVVITLLACDMGFYNYFQDHINILFYVFNDD